MFQGGTKYKNNYKFVEVEKKRIEDEIIELKEKEVPL
jgi:hypothetical protein